MQLPADIPRCSQSVLSLETEARRRRRISVSASVLGDPGSHRRAQFTLEDTRDPGSHCRAQFTLRLRGFTAQHGGCGVDESKSD